jgi:hypothetical protein
MSISITSYTQSIDQPRDLDLPLVGRSGMAAANTHGAHHAAHDIVAGREDAAERAGADTTAWSAAQDAAYRAQHGIRG